MKKSIAVVLITMVVLVLGGCELDNDYKTYTVEIKIDGNCPVVEIDDNGDKFIYYGLGENEPYYYTYKHLQYSRATNKTNTITVNKLTNDTTYIEGKIIVDGDEKSYGYAEDPYDYILIKHVIGY